MRTPHWSLLPVASALVACLLGSTAWAGSKVKVSGYVAIAPFSGRVASLDNVGIQILNVGVEPAKVLASLALNTKDPNCLPALCPWSVDDVDLSRAKMGLGVAVGNIGDSNKVWVPTVTMTAGPTHITEALKKGVLERQYAYAVNEAGLVSLGRVINRPPAEVLRDGLFVGMALGRRSETNPMTGFPPFVQGATVNGPATAQIIYPNRRFTATGQATAEGGAFVLLPKGPKQGAGTYQIVGPSGESRTWSPLNLSMKSDVLFAVLFPAQE